MELGYILGIREPEKRGEALKNKKVGAYWRELGTGDNSQPK